MHRDPELVRLDPHPDAAASALPAVRIYLGTEDAQLRAERVFFYSIDLVRDPARAYEIYLMKNLEWFSTRSWRTNFTNYRFAIPDFAGRLGKAIYNDVDQIYLADPAELFDLEMGSHGYLAVSANDTSVMLLDCARMAKWWNHERARSLEKAELLAGPAADLGLWGTLDGQWNARDLEYVEGRSKCVHFTALHTQPWQPTPEQYSYHPHPMSDVWDRLERAADAEIYQVFGPAQPSRDFRAAAVELRGQLEPPPAAPWSPESVAWLAQFEASSMLRCSFGAVERVLTPIGGHVTDYDLAGDPAGPQDAFDVVLAGGLFERAPLHDVPWMLDRIFGHARDAVAAQVVCAEQASGSSPRSPDWWRSQFAAVARRFPQPSWRLELFVPEGGRASRHSAYEAPGARGETSPTIWVLLGSKTGDNRQLLSLADALGSRYETKRLAFNSLHHLPPLFLDGSASSIDRSKSDPLAPPWPDLVISAGKRSVPVARWIRAQSRDATRLVHVGRPWAPLSWFDLIITTPQYALPARPNVLHNTMPLNRIAQGRLVENEADERWRSEAARLPTPRIAVLVGGNSSSQVLTTASAQTLGEEASRLAAAAGGSLLITTSPRTPAAAVGALRSAITVPALFHVFANGRADNAYESFLALADQVIATGDSASMLAEACSTGKPVYIFPIPHVYETVPGGRSVVDFLRQLRAARVTYRGTPKQQDVFARFYDQLVERGLVMPPRDLDAYHQALETRGLASRLGTQAQANSPTGPDDLERAVARVRELLRGERRVPA